MDDSTDAKLSKYFKNFIIKLKNSFEQSNTQVQFDCASERGKQEVFWSPKSRGEE